MSHKVIIDKVVKKYGDVLAVNEISVEIEKGEFFTLLGPSGCGKTTLLRMIAGFNSIDGGKIYFDDECINDKYILMMNASMTCRHINEISAWYFKIMRCFLI